MGVVSLDILTFYIDENNIQFDTSTPQLFSNDPEKLMCWP